MVIQLLPTGGVKLNIDYGSTPPSDTSKLWVPLSGKPDKVECTPTIQFGENTIEKFSSTIPDAQKFLPGIIVRGDYLYVVGGASSTYYGYGSTAVTKINLKTGAQSTLSASLPNKMNSQFCAEVNGKLYLLGGTTSGSSTAVTSVYVFDPQSETVTTATPLPIAMRVYSNSPIKNCPVIGKKIYILGFVNVSGNVNLNIYSYDVETGITKDTGVRTKAISSGAAAVGNVIYAFRGYTGSEYYNKWYKYDTVSNTVTDGNGFVYDGTAAASIGKYIYLFLGNYGAYQNIIQRFDTTTETIETLTVNTSVAVSVRVLCIYGLDIYVAAGNRSSSTFNNTIEKFSTNSPLTENHLFLQEDFGTDGLWSALKSKDTDLKVKVINAYLGDSNNIAQLTNAYLYDTASSQWKSLSGESYVADMQNALNILGVT